MQAVRALGVGLLLLSVYFWSRTAVVGDQVCGTAYDLWRGHWSPPSGDGGDTTKACLDQATLPVVAANGLMLLGVAALLVGTIGVTRRALSRRRGWAAELGMALSWGVLAAVLVASSAVYLDPGPICPWIKVGGYDEYARVVQELEQQGSGLMQCTAASPGLMPIDYAWFAALFGFPAGVVLWVGITTCARLRARPERRGGRAAGRHGGARPATRRTGDRYAVGRRR